MPTAELADVENNAVLRAPECLFSRELRQRFGNPSPVFLMS